MKKILVCGGSGFIGLNVIKFFVKKNYKITATYKTNKPKNKFNAKWIKADLTSPKNVRKIVKNQDIIIQCAGITSGAKKMVSKPFLLVGDNVIMNSLLVKEAVQNKGSYKIHTPLITLSKAEIIKKGISLKVDYSITSSCYKPNKYGNPCGFCDACILRKKGFENAGFKDPLDYQ